jgi:hypothetical protein
MTAAMIMIFNNVPKPGVCRNGIHNNRTPMPIKNVDIPIPNPELLATPCEKTVHGLTPTPALMRSASPTPNNTRPKHNRAKVGGAGKKLSGAGELQLAVGTDLTRKKSSIAIPKIDV